MRITPSTKAPDRLVTEFLAAKAAVDSAQERLKEAQEALAKQMEADQRKTFKWVGDGKQFSLTYTTRSNPVVDEVGLRKALTAKVYDKYTIKKLDRKALEAALDTGDVDPVVVSKFVTMQQSKPFLTYRESELNDD